MITLFHTEFETKDIDPPVAKLLTTIANFQALLTSVTNEVYTRTVTNQESAQKISKQQYYRLVDSMNDVVVAIAHTPLTDQRFTIGIYNNTIVDILIQSIYDNNLLTTDPLLYKFLREWEQHVIIPLFTHLAATENLAVLNNEPLIGEAALMERWVVFSGDPKRGIYQTLGSALSKGFYRALIIVIRQNRSSLHIPSTFLGNLLGWGLLTTRIEDQQAIVHLCEALRINGHYRPCPSVYKIAEPHTYRAIKHVTLDLIRDNQVGLVSDPRDSIPPYDLFWQNRLLNEVRMVLDRPPHRVTSAI
jgi:hypothetical protein